MYRWPQEPAFKSKEVQTLFNAVQSRGESLFALTSRLLGKSHVVGSSIDTVPIDVHNDIGNSLPLCWILHTLASSLPDPDLTAQLVVFLQPTHHPLGHEAKIVSHRTQRSAQTQIPHRRGSLKGVDQLTRRH